MMCGTEDGVGEKFEIECSGLFYGQTRNWSTLSHKKNGIVNTESPYMDQYMYRRNEIQKYCLRKPGWVVSLTRGQMDGQ